MKTQVRIAISTDVWVAILKREPKVDRSLSDILQILSLTLFEKPPVFQAIAAIKNDESGSLCPSPEDTVRLIAGRL